VQKGEKSPLGTDSERKKGLQGGRTMLGAACTGGKVPLKRFVKTQQKGIWEKVGHKGSFSNTEKVSHREDSLG